MKMKKMIALNSVGCYVNSETGITYPMEKDGNYDKNCGVHLNDIDEYWYYKLSPSDNIIIQDILAEYENDMGENSTTSHNINNNEH